MNVGGDSGITAGSDPRATGTEDRSGGSGTVHTTTSVSPEFNIDVDTNRLVREITDEVDDAIEEVRRDLERELEQLESELDDLERDIRRGR